jgi:hypothetical protein
LFSHLRRHGAFSPFTSFERHHQSHLYTNDITTYHDLTILQKPLLPRTFYDAKQTYRHERFSRKHDEWNGMTRMNSLSLFVNGRIVNDHEDLNLRVYTLYLLNDMGRPMYLLSLDEYCVSQQQPSNTQIENHSCCCLHQDRVP